MEGQWKVGGLYSIDRGNSSFGIVKVLALDPGLVHVRIYKNKFAARPDTVDPSTLVLGNVFDDGDFGIGHTPLAREHFKSWQPVFVMQTDIADEELEGYKFWKESTGGDSRQLR